MRRVPDREAMFRETASHRIGFEIAMGQLETDFCLKGGTSTTDASMGPSAYYYCTVQIQSMGPLYGARKLMRVSLEPNNPSGLRSPELENNPDQA